MNGLCPQGVVSALLRSVSIHAELVLTKTLYHLYFTTFFFTRFRFLLHVRMTKANMASATLVSAYVLRICQDWVWN